MGYNSLEIIRQLQREYSDTYESMNWITPKAADQASRIRKSLITAIFIHPASGAGWQFEKTKLFAHAISPGCALCGSGDWSCLFINGICNARCFYCPSDQTETGAPMTNTLEFKNPVDYADYVRIFNIRGVSFSGGEPFMTFDRVLLFLKTLRSRISHPLYIWMYTNGLLVTGDNLKALRDCGLDEIRFDISANHYRLDALKKAVGIIPTVTVEIPAIPEDLEQTRLIMRPLFDKGVHYLNLHQLRCTPFNLPKLMQRAYTFLHGNRVTVLETELAALELIRYSLEQNIPLPINYCSFTFRHQFQRAGAQKRSSFMIKAAHEDVTQNGHIRTMSISGEKKTMGPISHQLQLQGIDTSLWRVSKTCDQIFFNASLWPHIDFSGVRLKISYSGTSLKSTVSFHNPFKEVPLNRKKKVVIERQTMHPGIWLEGEQIFQFGHTIGQPETCLSPDSSKTLPQDLLNGIKDFEFFNPGLAEYF